MKTRSTKKSLVLSALSLMLCIAMLIGTTYAWFTDSVTSGKNSITSGNLDIEMYYADGTKDPSSVTWTNADGKTIFDYDLWEPGYVQVNHIKIANVGTLALKYQLDLVVDGEAGDLANVLDVYASVGEATQAATREDLADTNKFLKLGTLASVLANSSLDLTGNLMPAGITGKTSENTLTIAVKMQEEAGNEYKNATIGNGFTVVAKAAQYTYEEDSFNNQYDKNATYPEVSIAQTIVVKPGQTAQTAVVGALTDPESGDTLKLPASGGEVSLQGKTVASGKTIVGAPGTTLKVATGGAAPSVNADGVTFDSVTFDFGNQTYNSIKGHVIFKNCTFNGLVNSYDNSEYINCTFNNTDGNYLAHVYCGKASYTGCTFNGSNRCVYVYTDGYDATASFTDCTFTMTSETPDKSAIMLNARNNGEYYTVTIKDCTQTGGNDQGTASADGPNYDYRGLYGFKHDPAQVKATVTLDGTVVYKNPAE